MGWPLNRVFTIGLTEKMIIEQRHEGREGVCHVDPWEELVRVSSKEAKVAEGQ